MSTAPASTAAFPLEGPHAVETLPLNPNQPQPHPIIATLDSILMISHKPPKHPVAKWIWKQRSVLIEIMGVPDSKGRTDPTPICSE
jgi:hypothetical protein